MIETVIKKGPWNKGIPLSEEAKEWQRITHLGKKHSEVTKQKISLITKGEKNGFYGKNHDEKTRKRMSESHKGKKLPEETRKKMSQSQIGIKKGEKCHWWRGGITHNPYSVDWTNTLRRSIRERDKYTCKVCNKIQEERSFSVHHIDYDKNNCDPKNLITLCTSCHTKTNVNREEWIIYFRNFFRD